MTARDEKALATTRLRAKTLFHDGYIIHVNADQPGVYAVETPIKRARGVEFRDTYAVDSNAGTCTCPAYLRFAECKHSAAVVAAVREARRLLGPSLTLLHRRPSATP